MLTGSCNDPGDRTYGGLNSREVKSSAIKHAALGPEVVLHIDYDDRGLRDIKHEYIGLCVDDRRARVHSLPPLKTQPFSVNAQPCRLSFLAQPGGAPCKIQEKDSIRWGPAPLRPGRHEMCRCRRRKAMSKPRTGRSVADRRRKRRDE